jgi:hypothetical protein
MDLSLCNRYNLYSRELVGWIVGWWGGGGGIGFGGGVGSVSLHQNTKKQLHLQHPQTTTK